MKPTTLCTVAAMACLVSISNAQEHEHGGNLPDWYDPACCNQRDCRPVKDEDIEFATDPQTGLPVVHYKPTGTIFRSNQFKQSQDERYHVCISYVASPICVYIRPGV